MFKETVCLIVLCAVVLTGCVTIKIPKNDLPDWVKEKYIRRKPAPQLFFDVAYIDRKSPLSYDHEKLDNIMPLPPEKIKPKSKEKLKSILLSPIKNRIPKFKKPVKVSDLIGRSNEKAIRGPKKESFQESIIRYEYVEGAIYTIISSPGYLTDISLQKGELIENLSAGDTVNFQVHTFGDDIEHVIIKPIHPGIKTNLMVHTTKRNYYINLESHERIHMTGIIFSYPKEEFAKQQKRKKQNLGSYKTSDLNFDFIVESKCKDCLMPRSIFADTRNGKVYIVMPSSVNHQKLPALFGLDAKGNAEMINYRFSKDSQKFMIDGLYNRLMLQYGGKSREVYIYKAGHKPKKIGSFLGGIFSHK